MAMGYALASGSVTFDDLKDYKKSFKESEKFKNYTKRNPGHEADVKDLIVSIKCADLFQRMDEENLDKDKIRIADVN